MKIFIFGGVPSSLCNFRGSLMVSLMRSGHEVHACANGLTSDLENSEWLRSQGIFCHDVKLARTGINPISDCKTLISLVFLLRSLCPDIFLGYTAKPVIWGLLASALTKVPMRVALITGLGYAFTGDAGAKRLALRRLVRWLYSWALSKAHLVFFQNPDDQRDFHDFGLLSPYCNSAILNGSGVDLARFLPTHPPYGDIQFLMIARLLGDKGVREYVKAAEQLSRIYPNIGFNLIGGTDCNPDSISMAEVLFWEKAGVIKWHGEVKDVRPALSRSHVYVLPSYREGTPRTVLEAMAMARPIITTDAPGCRETIVDGESGFIVPIKDSEALATAMQRFIENPLLVPEMGAKARLRAVEKYDVNLVNAAMLSAMGLSEHRGLQPEK